MFGQVEESIPNIGIAVVLQDYHVLIGIRAEDMPLAGYHEFPGGKCQPDENSQKCAERECLEETGLKVIASERLLDTVHKYDHGTVHLHFWLCEIDSSCEKHTPSNNFRWCNVSELGDLNFPQGNEELLQILRTRFTVS